MRARLRTTRRGPRGAPVVYTLEFIALTWRSDSGREEGVHMRGGGGGEKEQALVRERNLCSHYATTEIHYERHALSRFGDRSTKDDLAER